MGFTNYLITEHVPDNTAIWLSESIQSKFLFLLSLNIFLIIVGCLMDIFAAIIVITPLLLPVAAALVVAVSLDTLPPPRTTSNATSTPATGKSCASVTSTCGAIGTKVPTAVD